jgi:hypothetical protein
MPGQSATRAAILFPRRLHEPYPAIDLGSLALHRKFHGKSIMRPPSRRSAAFLLLVCAACADGANRATLPPDPRPETPRPLGVYTIAVTGIVAGEPRSTITPARTGDGRGARATLANAGAGLVFEQVSTSTLTEGARGARSTSPSPTGCATAPGRR